jgi:large subunit ribosomal protein L13
MKTYSPKLKDIQRSWFVVDADGATLGRLASEVAHVLRGKHKPTYAPHMDMGDHVIVVNASKVRVTGAKAADKVYYHHSQYPGGLSEVPYERLAQRHPERIIERAVRGMLPRNRLGRQMLRKLAVYAEGEHPHQAQGPVPLELRSARRGDGGRTEKVAAAPQPEKES